MGVVVSLRGGVAEEEGEEALVQGEVWKLLMHLMHDKVTIQHKKIPSISFFLYRAGI